MHQCQQECSDSIIGTSDGSLEMLLQAHKSMQARAKGAGCRVHSRVMGAGCTAGSWVVYACLSVH